MLSQVQSHVCILRWLWTLLHSAVSSTVVRSLYCKPRKSRSRRQGSSDSAGTAVLLKAQHAIPKTGDAKERGTAALISHTSKATLRVLQAGLQQSMNQDLQFSSLQFHRSVMSNSLRPHESQHTRPPCPSPSPGVYANSCPSSR